MMAEAFYRLKSAGGAWTRVTGTVPITITGLTEGATYEYLKGDGTIGEVTAGVAATVVPGITASDSLSGRDLAISVDSLTGDPSPSVALTSLTLDGANVLGNEVGSDPWLYTVPSSSSDQAVAWTVEATNSAGTDTASGLTSVSANLVAPTATTAPTISGTVSPGETVTLNEGTYTGTTPITITFTLTLDGVDVTADVASNSYTTPAGAEGQSLVYTETASNGIAPDATQSVTETVQAVASGSEMLLTLSGDDLVLSNPQELVLTGSDLSFQATTSTSATIEAINDQGQVADTGTVNVTGPGILGTVGDILPGLGSGFYTFRLRTDDTAAAYTVPEAPDATTTMQSTITKDGVTFTLDQAYPVGQYANGDYFVVAPSGGSLLSTSPASETTSATSTVSGISLPNRIINGLAVNPGYRQNPWDSYSEGTNNETNTSYNGTYNVDPGNNAGAAYGFVAGESLVKAVSLTTPPDNSRPALEKFVVLTIVNAPPKAGAFRPPPWGNNKNVPDSWREDAIDWRKVPQIDAGPGTPTPDWGTLGPQALVTWQTGNLWGNGVRNITPDSQPTYRRDIGERLGKFVHALTTPGTKTEKRDVMVGTLQIAIDQVAAGEIDTDTDLLDPSNRYDIGRRAPSVLAALLLPENQRIMDSLNLGDGWKWQDTSSFGYITQDVINHKDDDTERGAVDGMQGIPEYANARPQALSGTPPNRPDLIFGAIALQGTTRATYRRIGLRSEFLGATAIHLFEGAAEIYNNPAIVHYNDRWVDIIESGWPGIGEKNVFGELTGYMTGGSAIPPADIDFMRSTRDLMEIPRLDTLGLMPERPEPPELIENGTQLIVKPLSPYVGYGAAQTQMDIRYIPLSSTGAGTELDPLVWSAAGPWTEINDAQPNPNGDFLVSPTALGGLTDNTRYAVAIRYRSTRGIGPWSNNWTFGYAPGTTTLWEKPWLRGIVTTTTEKSATAPSFNTQPVLDSYFTEGRPIKAGNIDSTGFPVPAVTYQWFMDGTPVAGETSDVFFTSAGDAGKMPSVEVTLTNAEGTASKTVTGDVIAVGSGDTGYRPTLYQADGNISIYAQADGPIDPLPMDDVQKATFALWLGQDDVVFQARARSTISVSGNFVSVTLKDSGGLTVASYTFGDFDPGVMAWYLISIDATDTTVSERIKVWRKPEGSPYPAERLPTVSVGTAWTGDVFVLARLLDSADYWQRLYRARVEGEISTLSDYWAKDGVALLPEDFWNDAGYPYNVDNVGTASDGIGIPRVRMGGSQTEAQFNARENSGSAGSPLPAENPGTPIIQSGVINVGE